MKPSHAWILMAASACSNGVDPPIADRSATMAATPTDRVGSPCVLEMESHPDFRGFNEREVVIEDATDSDGLVCLVNHFRGHVTRPASQCADRPAEKTVYRSCRCANSDGRTDDGARYCACPDDYSCTQLVSQIGPGDAISGSYCIKRGTAYDPATACR